MKGEQVVLVSDSDERQRVRVSYSAMVHVETGDRREIKGKLRDVGLNSLYLVTDKENNNLLIYGEAVSVKITLQGDSSSLTIELEGSIGRMDDSGFVVQFSNSLRWWPVFIMFPNSKEN